MKYLIICEGSAEKAVIDMLIDNHKLIIDREDLLNLQVFVASKIDQNPTIEPHLRNFLSENQKIIVWHICDTIPLKRRKKSK